MLELQISVTPVSILAVKSSADRGEMGVGDAGRGPYTRVERGSVFYTHARPPTT